MWHEEIFILCDVSYALFFIRTQFIRTSKLRFDKKNENKLRAKWSSDYAQ